MHFFKWFLVVVFCSMKHYCLYDKNNFQLINKMLFFCLIKKIQLINLKLLQYALVIQNKNLWLENSVMIVKTFNNNKTCNCLQNSVIFRQKCIFFYLYLIESIIHFVALPTLTNNLSFSGLAFSCFSCILLTLSIWVF